jgi:hypothetical protein
MGGSGGWGPSLRAEAQKLGETDNPEPKRFTPFVPLATEAAQFPRIFSQAPVERFQHWGLFGVFELLIFGTERWKTSQNWSEPLEKAQACSRRMRLVQAGIERLGYEVPEKRVFPGQPVPFAFLQANGFVPREFSVPDSCRYTYVAAAPGAMTGFLRCRTHNVPEALMVFGADGKAVDVRSLEESVPRSSPPERALACLRHQRHVQGVADLYSLENPAASLPINIEFPEVFLAGRGYPLSRVTRLDQACFFEWVANPERPAQGLVRCRVHGHGGQLGMVDSAGNLVAVVDGQPMVVPGVEFINATDRTTRAWNLVFPLFNLGYNVLLGLFCLYVHVRLLVMPLLSFSSRNTTSEALHDRNNQSAPTGEKKFSEEGFVIRKG